MAVPQHRRDVCIDALRGLCLVWMTFDHVPWNPVFAVSYEMLGFFSCAEVFVFLSGLVAGWVYTRLADREGNSAVWRRVVRRAGLVYAAYALYCALSLVARVRSGDSGAWSILAERMLLWREAGILPLYLVLLTATPLLVAWLRAARKRTVLILSCGTWLFAQLPAAAALNGPESDFHRLAWQVLFVAGLCTGFRRARGLPFFPEWIASIAPVAAVLCVTLLVLRHADLIDAAARRTGTLTSLHHLGPVRLLNFLLLLPLAASVPLEWRSMLERLRATYAVANLGRNSLFVYVCGWIGLALPWAQAGWWRTAPLTVQITGAAAVLACLWAAVGLRDMALVPLRTQPHRSRESSLIPS